MKDLTGMRFGKLSVVAFSHRKRTEYFWHTKCDCGNSKLIRGNALITAGQLSCGCLRRHRRDAGEYMGVILTPFTHEEDVDLVTLRAAGQSFVQIARSLKRSRAVVRRRWLRLTDRDRVRREEQMAERRRDKDRRRAVSQVRLSVPEKRFRALLHHVGSRSLNRARPHTLTLDNIRQLWKKQEGRCAYTGLTMTFKSGSPHTVSLDRIDSDEWYTPDNVVLCCVRANMMKLTDDVATFVEWCRKVVTQFDRTA